ncbi:unnamed protein product [Peniophora sp. CBMAI 1063]|nr:unnamed protein product [Peniophora sp. CBMAI 1063]
MSSSPSFSDAVLALELRDGMLYADPGPQNDKAHTMAFPPGGQGKLLLSYDGRYGVDSITGHQPCCTVVWQLPNPGTANVYVKHDAYGDQSGDQKAIKYDVHYGMRLVFLKDGSLATQKEGEKLYLFDLNMYRWRT